MHKWLLFSVTFLAGCAGTTWVKAPAPAEVFDNAQAVRASGVLAPYQVDFQSVSVFSGNSLRVVVLSPVGLKLLDMRLTPAQNTLYETQLPPRVTGAFMRWAKAYLFTPCPPQTFYVKDGRVRGVFQGERTSLCP